MTSFKFVCRENEIQEVISSLESNVLVVLRSQNNSGLSHFLKKIMQLLWKDKSACFYIDGESQSPLSDQIIGQVAMFSKDDSPTQNSASKLLRKTNKGDLVFSVVTSCLYALDVVPVFPSIGTIANSLITSIKETIDTDQEHLSDFKTEKAVAKFCELLIRKHIKNIYLLIDNSQKLKPDEYSFLSLLVERYQVRVLFAFNDSYFLNEAELFSKLPCTNGQVTHRISNVSNEFQRPDDKLIEALFRCYGKDFSSEIIVFFDRHERNIHVIMAYVLGVPMDITNIDDQMQYLLKILSVLDCPVPSSLLFKILRAENLRSMEHSDDIFQTLCNKAVELGLLRIDSQDENQAQVFALNKRIFPEGALSINYIEKQKIIVDAIAIMDLEIDSLTAPMLEFAISNLEHDYTHCKRYIIALSRIQNRKNRLNLTNLDKLNYFEEAEELFYVCSLYYNRGIYDKPYRLLQTHRNFSRKPKYKIAQALISERLHIDSYVHKLENLFEITTDREKKCLLATVLFVAYLNSDDSHKYKCFFQHTSKYYYKSFEVCKNYYYLLRNVTYYMEDTPTAISNYEKCLSFFKAKDPVNYNRTISNYICYLMRYDSNQHARKFLEPISEEVSKILEYNDPAYAYLNNNYGIYLMRYTHEDPSVYFSSIPYSAGTTETPYIYAQVNLALYYVRKNPRLALMTINSIENHVHRTPVPRTKQFYAINRALIEFANGIFPQNLLDDIINKPLRGDATFAQALYEQYLSNKESDNALSEEDFNAMSLPGYLFYRYFKAEMLLSDF
ncbi:MAG TPA: hypothetical protein GX523_15760 [Desulfitobacterium dehalogenans]|uniref:Uncharacterized protein n=1 Tax=Desulfitobacterium dehalogenans TaxID=36854 RepID=A0A7C6Z6A9_9FIRM|nr:hypothetical protein [Desulfitobacterium dehalogenans]